MPLLRISHKRLEAGQVTERRKIPVACRVTAKSSIVMEHLFQYGERGPLFTAQRKHASPIIAELRQFAYICT
jgi:hypothetical protein